MQTQTQVLNRSGYRLIKNVLGQYEVQSKHGVYEGSLIQVWQKMNWDYKIHNSEVRLALREMEKNRHSVAEFGIFGSFILTKRSR